MRAHQIMTRQVTTVRADTPIRDAAGPMLRQRISGLPVVDENNRLVGIVSEGDFIRRSEIGTESPYIGWLDFLWGPGKAAVDFAEAFYRALRPAPGADDSSIFAASVRASSSWPSPR